MSLNIHADWGEANALLNDRILCCVVAAVVWGVCAEGVGLVVFAETGDDVEVDV